MTLPPLQDHPLGAAPAVHLHNCLRKLFLDLDHLRALLVARYSVLTATPHSISTEVWRREEDLFAVGRSHRPLRLGGHFPITSCVRGTPVRERNCSRRPAASANRRTRGGMIIQHRARYPFQDITSASLLPYMPTTNVNNNIQRASVAPGASGTF